MNTTIKQGLIWGAIIIGLAMAYYFAYVVLNDDHDHDMMSEAEERAVTEDVTENIVVDSDEDIELTGLTIMSDGTVVLGDGRQVLDATVSAEGMVILGDGTVVEPEFDMRAEAESTTEVMVDDEGEVVDESLQ